MNLIKIKNPPTTGEVGGAAAPPFDTPPPPPPPPLEGLVGGAHRNLTKFLSSPLKVVPRLSEAFLVSFWTDEKPYKYLLKGNPCCVVQCAKIGQSAVLVSPHKTSCKICMHGDKYAAVDTLMSIMHI